MISFLFVKVANKLVDIFQEAIQIGMSFLQEQVIDGVPCNLQLETIVSCV